MRIFLSAPRATVSNAGFALTISLSPGVSRTGTLRCISTLAAAEEEMGLAARSGAGASGASLAGGGAGTVMVSPHDGQAMSVPTPAPSTASSCSQLGQLKTMSISLIG